MTNAPDKLWVDPTGVDELDMYIAHASDTMDYLNMDVEYTRTDIADARVNHAWSKVYESDTASITLAAEAFTDYARIGQLERALENISCMGFDIPATLELTDEAWSRRRAGLMQQIALEALKEAN
jgi:hypothetical protein